MIDIISKQCFIVYLWEWGALKICAQGTITKALTLFRMSSYILPSGGTIGPGMIYRMVGADYPILPRALK